MLEASLRIGEETGGKGLGEESLRLLETKGSTVLIYMRVKYMRDNMLCYNLHDIILHLFIILYFECVSPNTYIYI